MEAINIGEFIDIESILCQKMINEDEDDEVFEISSSENECDNKDDEEDDQDDDQEAQNTAAKPRLPFNQRVLTRRQYIEQLPISTRTKRGCKRDAASMKQLAKEYIEGIRPSLPPIPNKLQRLETKKRHSMKDEIHEAVEENMKDPELSRLLQKIAYCRVFTNYLFRQYDMLSIDFEHSSNFDNLMVDLMKRVGAYNAIRRCRLGIPSASSSGQAGAANSNTEGRS